MMRLAGLVLSGGRARRLGRDKPQVVLGGRTLLARACDLLAGSCRWVAVSVHEAAPVEAIAGPQPAVVLPDPPQFPRGPLAGIASGLRWAAANGADLLVTLPCDAPFLPADLPRRLADAASDGGGCAVARTPDGLQPLCAAWRPAALEAFEPRLAAGEHPSVRAVLAALGCTFVDYADAAAFLNINTPEDFAEAERRLARGPEA
jgi:molybdopterin-guanine dinucleotide biosynthesis protein A